MQTMTTAPPQTQIAGLYKVTCYDKKNDIGLSAYSNLIVRDKNNHVVVIRIGGYPEHVRAMSDAINAGCVLGIQTEDQSISVKSEKPNGYCKKLAFDGLYAESTLYLTDDQPQSLSLTGDDGETTTVTAKRNLYIFCEDGSEETLFAELDRKLAVPLIPEFQDYFLEELEKHKILNKLKVWSPHFPLFAYHLEVSDDESEIGIILETGLKTEQIQIPGTHNGNITEISTFTQYLNTFSGMIADRIKGSFSPLFDPATEDICDKLKNANSFIKEHTGYELYPAQLACSEAIKRVLEIDNVGFIVAECGTGKTKLGATALYSTQKRKSFNAVICPSHLCKKWVRELHETLPNTRAVVIQSLNDVDKAYEMFKSYPDSVYCVISKEKARDGYMRQPSVYWSAANKGYVCPTCGKVVEMDLFDDGTKYTVPADMHYFKKENSKNHKCRECGALLWSVLNPDVLVPQKTPWVKIGVFGFVYRKFAKQYLDNMDFCRKEFREEPDPKFYQRISDLVNNPNMVVCPSGACRRYPISAYIKNKIKKLDGLICDELHQYSGDSGQGQAMAELAGIAKKVIGMTATLINGYSKGMFFLLFRLKSNLMLMDNQKFEKAPDFCKQYGVMEAIYELGDDPYNAKSRSRKCKKRERFLPGVSPLVYSRFLMNNAVFLSLNDMGKELPEYEEIPVMFNMAEDVSSEYNRIEKTLKEFIESDRRLAMRIMSKYLNLLSAYPDQPYNHEPILHPITGEPLVEPANLSDIDTLNEKDKKILELVERKVAAGERVIIYTAWTRLDTQQKLLKLLSEKGYRTKILHASVSPQKREEWVEKQVKSGIDVLICNPALVETGLDLNAFTTLIFYNVAYNLYIFRQASRRSWRINQTTPRVEVYIFYYSGTMQFRAMKLMASKLAAATVIEGNISEEGLAAMSDCEDMTTLLAKELVKGIKNEVDDLADSFKKMAILKSGENSVKVDRSVKPKVIPIEKPVSKQPGYEGQMTLFDLLAS